MDSTQLCREYRPIENRCGIDFDQYRCFMMSITGDRNQCIIACENRGVNLYNWYPDPHLAEGWIMVGVLPNSSPLDLWAWDRPETPKDGVYPAGTLMVFWELDLSTGCILS
jgi:hypothetical protein